MPDLALFSAPRARLWECCRTGGRRLLGCDDERMRFVSLSLSFSSLLTELGAVAVPVESAAGPPSPLGTLQLENFLGRPRGGRERR